MSNPTFAAVTSFLGQLGFEKQVIPGSHVLFKNDGADVQIVLRLYREEEPVDQTGLVYIRHTLDQWGIMERDQFDEQMRQQSLAG